MPRVLVITTVGMEKDQVSGRAPEASLLARCDQLPTLFNLLKQLAFIGTLHSVCPCVYVYIYIYTYTCTQHIFSLRLSFLFTYAYIACVYVCLYVCVCVCLKIWLSGIAVHVFSDEPQAET